MRALGVFVIFAVAVGFSLTILPITGEANQSGQRNAAVLYSKYCVSCHGRDGQAKTSKGKQTSARDLTDSEWQDRTSDERLFNSITNGKRKMPGFSKKLSEKETEFLVSYVRGLKR